MPLFQFHLVGTDKREHVGSLDLSARDEAASVTVRLAMNVLAALTLDDDVGQGLTLQATDEAGGLVYTIDIMRHSTEDDRTSGCLN